MKFADRKIYTGFQALLKMLAESMNEGIDESFGPDWKSYLATPDTALACWGLDKVELPWFEEVFSWELYRGDWGDGLCPDWEAIGITEKTADDVLHTRGFHFVKQEFYSKSDEEWMAKYSKRPWDSKHASEYLVITGSTFYAGYDTLCFWVLERVEVVM